MRAKALKGWADPIVRMPKSGWMLAVGAVALLVLLSSFPAPASPGHPGGVRADYTLTTPPSVQSSTASGHNATTQVWVQTGATLYFGHATWRNWTFNVAAYSQLYSASMAFIIQPQAGYGAQVLISQGAAVLANRTTGQAISFSVGPTVGTTPVTERVTYVRALNGSVPAVGYYAVMTNVTSTIQFALFTPNLWNYTLYPTLFNESHRLSTSSGMWLNSTTISFPLPSSNLVQVNLSTVLVTINGTTANYQLSSASVIVLSPNLAPGTYRTATVTWTPLPTPVGGPVLVTLLNVPTTNSTYDYSATWTNNNLTAYNGVYVLAAKGFVGTMAGVNVYANSRQLPSSAFSVNGYNVTILPNVQPVYLGEPILFVVTFSAAGLPPVILSIGAPFVTYGGLTFTWGDVLLTGMFLTLIYIILVAVQVGGRRDALSGILAQWKALGLLIGLASVYVVGTFV
ncbi:MAG: hypothetical protein WCB19_05635 [Thermoplasmata archaeon]